jgi:hypothetical protein
MNIIKVIINSSPQYPLRIGYDEECIKESVSAKFRGFQIDNQLK